GDDSERDFRQTDLRFLGRDADVTRQCELASAAECEAVDGGDHGPRKALDEGEDELAALRSLLTAERCLLRELVDVGTRDEGLVAATGDDDRLDVFVFASDREDAIDLFDGFGVQRIQDFRTVDGQKENSVAKLDL